MVMKVVTYWICDCEYMEINLESLRKGGYCFKCNVPILFENISEETLSWEKLFCCGKH